MPTDFRGNSIKMMDSQTPNWEPEENQSGEDIHYHGKIVDKSLVNEILRQHKKKKTMNNLTLERIAELRERIRIGKLRINGTLEDVSDLLAILDQAEGMAEVVEAGSALMGLRGRLSPETFDDIAQRFRAALALMDESKI